MRRALIGITLGLLFVTGCTSQPTAQRTESENKQTDYELQVKNQPAEDMNGWSPTRQTANGWVKTWREPGKLAYVYLIASNGQMVGYYVFEGPPNNKCIALTPTWTYEEYKGSNFQVPAPSVDGAYYSSNQCQDYYGFDAVSGAYMEYTIGAGISHLFSSEPMPRQDVEPLGVATVETVKKNN